MSVELVIDPTDKRRPGMLLTRDSAQPLSSLTNGYFRSEPNSSDSISKPAFSPASGAVHAHAKCRMLAHHGNHTGSRKIGRKARTLTVQDFIRIAELNPNRALCWLAPTIQRMSQ